MENSAMYLPVNARRAILTNAWHAQMEAIWTTARPVSLQKRWRIASAKRDAVPICTRRMEYALRIVAIYFTRTLLIPPVCLVPSTVYSATTQTTLLNVLSARHLSCLKGTPVWQIAQVQTLPCRSRTVHFPPLRFCGWLTARIILKAY